MVDHALEPPLNAVERAPAAAIDAEAVILLLGPVQRDPYADLVAVEELDPPVIQEDPVRLETQVHSRHAVHRLP